MGLRRLLILVSNSYLSLNSFLKIFFFLPDISLPSQLSQWWDCSHCIVISNRVGSFSSSFSHGAISSLISWRSLSICCFLGIVVVFSRITVSLIVVRRLQLGEILPKEYLVTFILDDLTDFCNKYRSSWLMFVVFDCNSNRPEQVILEQCLEGRVLQKNCRIPCHLRRAIKHE